MKKATPPKRERTPVRFRGRIFGVKFSVTLKQVIIYIFTGGSVEIESGSIHSAYQLDVGGNISDLGVLRLVRDLSEREEDDCLLVLAHGLQQWSKRLTVTEFDHEPPLLVEGSLRTFIDYKTSMITDEDLLRGLLFY